MRFEKKLVILSGLYNGAKGTLSIERNALGVFCSISLSNLPSLIKGEFALGLKSGETKFKRRLGRGTRLVASFDIPDLDLGTLHAVIFDYSTDSPIAYGTTSATRLWQGNLMDGLRKTAEEIEKEKAEELLKIPLSSADTIFSPIEKDVRDYFFDIHKGTPISIPSEIQSTAKQIEECDQLLETAFASDGYNDAQVASINYYDAQISNPYSTRGEIEPQSAQNPIDRILEDNGVSIKSIKEGCVKTLSVNESGDHIPPPSAYSAQTAASETETRKLLFFEQIKDQLDGLFEKEEKCPELEALLPDSKWIKIAHDSKRYYGVGVIGSPPTYLAYAVPASFTVSPPIELGDKASWVPVDPLNPTEKGFWVLFQSATSGESVA